MPRHAAQEGTKRGRGSVHLVVMGAVGKGAELVDKGVVPITLDDLHEPMLALRGKWIGAECGDAVAKAEGNGGAALTRISSPREAPKLLHKADAVIDRADGNSDEHGEDEAV